MADAARRRAPAGGRPHPKGAPVPMISIDGIEVQPPLLRDIVAGAGVDTHRDYEATYGIFSVPVGGAGRVGTLTLRRTRELPVDGAAAPMTTLKLSIADGQCKGYVRKVEAVIHCHDNALLTPWDWIVHEELVAGDTTVPHTKIRKRGVANMAHVAIFEAAGDHAIPMRDTGFFALRWALFDAVGRLPRQPSKPLSFELIDHFDQHKRDNRLQYRSSTRVRLGEDQETPLHLFDHVGRGNLPWTYCVNDGGVLVLAVGGLAAYGLLGARQTATEGDAQ